MNIDAIVLDIDGTLLNSQQYIPADNLKALYECSCKGIMLYIATARPSRLVFRDYETKTGNADFLTERGVYYNGAMAIDNHLDYIRHIRMDGNIVKAVTQCIIENMPDTQITIQEKEVYHSFWLPVDDSELRNWGFLRNELIPFSKASHLPCSKIVAWHKTKDMTEIYQKLLMLYGKQLNIFLTDSCQCIQFMPRYAAKEKALLELLKLREILPKNVAVFGDDMPDMGMFKTFECSIAMGNAKRELKEIATYTTLSNDQAGIAFAIREYLGIDY